MMNTFVEKYLDKSVNISKEEEQIWFSAKDVFEMLTLSWRGADSLWQRQIPKNWAIKKRRKTTGGNQNVWFINENAVKQIILKSTKQTEEMSRVAKILGVNIDNVLLRGENEFISILQAVSIGFGLKNIIITQYAVEDYRLDAYIEKFNLVIEYDEISHVYNVKNDQIRELEIIKHLTKIEKNMIKPPIIFRVKQGQELDAIQCFTSFLNSYNPLVLQADYVYLEDKKLRTPARSISDKQKQKQIKTILIQKLS